MCDRDSVDVNGVLKQYKNVAWNFNRKWVCEKRERAN